MTSPASRTAKGALAHAPFGAAGQRDVDLLGNVMMVGIDDTGTKDKQTGRDLSLAKWPRVPNTSSQP